MAARFRELLGPADMQPGASGFLSRFFAACSIPVPAVNRPKIPCYAAPEFPVPVGGGGRNGRVAFKHAIDRAMIFGVGEKWRQKEFPASREFGFGRGGAKPAA